MSLKAKLSWILVCAYLSAIGTNSVMGATPENRTIAYREGRRQETPPIVPNTCLGDGGLTGTQRWDLRMIDDAYIWKNLLVNYIYADRQKHWPERKAALNEILDKYPDSQWAGDAAVILACGQFEFEGREGVDSLKSNADAYAQGYYGNAEQAIDNLRNIINKYAQTPTMLEPQWGVGGGCRFDNTWLTSQGGLVFLNSDGSIRTSKPFDLHQPIGQEQKELLAYFEHRDKYPVYTKAVARVYISNLLALQGKLPDAAVEFEELLSDVNEFEAAAKAETAAASGPNGFLVRGLLRPEHYAYLWLMEYYEKTGESEKALAKTETLAPIMNQGANYVMIRRIGEVYAKYGLESKAQAQYRIAHEKVNAYIRLDVERSKRLEHIKPVEDGSISPELEEQALQLRWLMSEVLNGWRTTGD